MSAKTAIIVQAGLKEHIEWEMPVAVYDFIADPIVRWSALHGRPRPTLERFFRMLEQEMPEVSKQITVTRKPVEKAPDRPPPNWCIHYDELYRGPGNIFRVPPANQPRGKSV